MTKFKHALVSNLMINRVILYTKDKFNYRSIGNQKSTIKIKLFAFLIALFTITSCTKDDTFWETSKESSSTDMTLKGYTPKNDLTNWNSWMAAIKDNVPLARISIPGTHDSGTFELKNPIKRVWAKTQDCNFLNQMNNGIRFFDIRVRATNNNTFMLHHGSIYLYIGLHRFLNDAKTFLKQHPSETIIMSIKKDHTSAKNATKNVTDIFRDSYYSPNSIFYKANSDNPTLGETRGKIVIFNRLPNSSSISSFPYCGWKDNATFSHMINKKLTLNVQDQYNIKYWPKKDAIRNFLKKTNNNLDDRQLFINYTSLASGGTIWSSPYYFAKYFNPETAHFIEHNIKNRAGWVIMDYAGNKWNPKLHEKVILTNRSLTKK